MIDPNSGELLGDETTVAGTSAAGSSSPLGRLSEQVSSMESTGAWSGHLDRLDDLEPDELIRLLRHPAVAKRALDAIEARALNVVERRGSTVTRRGHRTRRWWANEMGMSHAHASHRVRVATRIHEHYPKIAAALEAGHLSFDCAAALIRRESERTREGFVELQDHLVRLAVFEPFERFEQAVEGIALRLDPDGPKPDDPRLNRLRITNEFGNTRITVLFDPVNAEVVLNAIRRAVDAERSAAEAATPQNPDDGTPASDKPVGSPDKIAASACGVRNELAAEVPVRNYPAAHASVGKEPQPETPTDIDPAAEANAGHESAGAADGSPADKAGRGGCGGALASLGPDNAGRTGQTKDVLADGHLGSDAVGKPDQPPDQIMPEDVHRLGALPEEPGDSIARLQGQAFLRICERAIVACDRPGRPPTAHIDLIMREDDVGFASTRTTGGLVHGDRLAELMCNAVYRLIKTDQAGTPLNVGRAQRLATADQRRAAFLRDGGCVFPRCAAPASATDLHHVDRWNDGGATDLENLACLCRFHHSVTHSAGWQMSAHRPTPTEPHRFEWITPTGDTLRSVHHSAGSPVPRPRAG